MKKINLNINVTHPVETLVKENSRMSIYTSFADGIYVYVGKLLFMITFLSGQEYKCLYIGSKDRVLNNEFVSDFRNLLS
jgi:hypothetical protein